MLDDFHCNNGVESLLSFIACTEIQIEIYFDERNLSSLEALRDVTCRVNLATSRRQTSR